MLVRIQVSRPENVNYFSVRNGDIVEIDIEDYLCGVVASEIGNASLEACKAQAIVSRTYVMPYVGDGKYITDQSSKHQAFRASRMGRNEYPNAIQGVADTAGMVLTYDGERLETCSYSSANGGKTVSSQERWGGYRPYLIAQDDPWDAAERAERASKGQSAAKGHGVGMSQCGAVWAAKNGIAADDILAFYYPGTEIVSDYGEGATDVAKTVNAADVIALFQRALSENWGYIWGKRGQTWTQEEQDAATREQTIKWGSKWVGCKVADCSGLFVWAYKQLGGYMYHGSNTMWNKYCARNGKLENGKRTDGKELRPGTAVFLVKSGNRSHVGLYIGGDTVIEAKGTLYGVVKSSITQWDEWGELISTSFDSADTAQANKLGSRTLRKGVKGDDVKELQTMLIHMGYSLGTYGDSQNGIDGSYGTMTEAAVTSYQEKNGLSADGVCGPKTLASLSAGAQVQSAQKYRLVIAGDEDHLRAVQSEYGGELEPLS